MRLHIASGNPEIRRLCQEVLGDILDCGWTLHVAATMSVECVADLYLWDLDSESEYIPNIATERWRQFYLVDRAEVQKLKESLSEAHILLKPLTRATLAAFLDDACKRAAQHPVCDGGTLQALRQDRDEILQFLMQANLKLQEYDQDRTNFLARAIHDFRAPLTAITGYCGLLLSDEVGGVEQREVLERIHRSARKLSRMASAMFQLSVAPRAEVALDMRIGDLRECVEHTINEIIPIAEEKRISIELEMAASPGPLSFEPIRLEQVFMNLLDNACKFTPRSGRIQVKGYPYFWERRLSGNTGPNYAVERRASETYAPNSYRIDISDSGPGIAPAHLSRIFEEYTSYGGGTDRSGGGLGLAICRMIINQHKGRIWAESSPVGAVFSFVLPFAGSSAIEVDPAVRVVQAAM